MDYVELSKEVSYALRHAPWEYELELDSEGWVSATQLLEALSNSGKWRNVNLEDLQYMINTSEKKRHEINNNKIRAIYGHSIPMKILKEVRRPPSILYHGTSHDALDSILMNGLLPRSRQYVHLSQDINIARQVGKRRDEKPVILKIDADLAYNQGISFYYGNEKVWLADTIPPTFIQVYVK
ncbi:MAG: RNA 2'-phosphotransferase [Herbinix sp.]|nr:RNA 2'-phosphotransferase [Herbinix sp.]